MSDGTINYPPYAHAAIARFVKANWPESVTAGKNGFYWTNLDGNVFAYNTYEECACDVAFEAGVTADEWAPFLR
jgi:hypothetical protein